ncbi:hypothetical protein G7Y89_g6651 [Cudoniella acicularis]|uniref:Uncharacterized protein n=1 Tax=Cudoniella acicularis TaxID=354080 RepID=A0A8H4RM97_9HELO|nr:hypothetical protein G7Y89_g6651 [Cudoniella acicularis]
MADFVDLCSSPPSTESAESAVFININTIRDGLDECLSKIESSGTFALFVLPDNPPNPGLYLKNGGTIGLPLSDRDAQAIVAASHAAPFGKGEETLVDTSLMSAEFGESTPYVRNTCHCAAVKALLSEWQNSVAEDKEMLTPCAFLFKHQYTNTSLRFDGLKGNDLQAAIYLRQACEKHGFCLYLTNFERTVEGGCDSCDEDGGWGGCESDFHAIIEEVERTASLKRVVDLEGIEVARDMSYSEDHFTRADPFEEVDPDDEDYSGYTGNEGVSVTHFYHKTVAIFMPKCYQIEFFLGPTSYESRRGMYGLPARDSTTPVIEWIEMLSNNISLKPNNPSAKGDLTQICEIVIRQMTEWQAGPRPESPWDGRPQQPFSNEILMRTLSISVDLDNEPLFKEMVDVCSERFSPAAFQLMAKASLRYNSESVLSKLTDELSFVFKLSKVIERTNAFRIGLEEEAKCTSKPDNAQQDWAKSEIYETLCVTEVSMDTAQDDLVLTDLAKQFTPQEIFDKILPAVKRNLNEFLINLEQQVGRFPLAERPGVHLRAQLNSMKGFTHTTEWTSSPQILVVTKTPAFQENHKDWERRCQVAKTHIQSFGAERLQEILGDQREALTNLHPARPQEAKPLPTPSLVINSSGSGRTLEPITKRKIPSNTQNYFTVSAVTAATCLFSLYAKLLFNRSYPYLYHHKEKALEKLLKLLSNLGNLTRIKFIPLLVFNIARQRLTTDETGVILYILGSVKVLIGKDDPRDYRGAGVKRTIVTTIEYISANVLAEALTSLYNLIKQDAHTLNKTSIQRLQRHVQKLTNAAQISFTERALLRDQNQFLTRMNNEAKVRRSTKPVALGKAKVMSYKDIEEARAKRAAKEAIRTRENVVGSVKVLR